MILMMIVDDINREEEWLGSLRNTCRSYVKNKIFKINFRDMIPVLLSNFIYFIHTITPQDP